MRLLPVLLLLILTGCPGPRPAANSGQPSHPAAKAGPKLKVELLRTDLGLVDGQYVREADAALAELAKSGAIEFSSIGELPAELRAEGGTGDIGLPGAVGQPGVTQPGSMTGQQASELARQLKDADMIVLSSPTVAGLVLSRVKAGTLKAGAVLLLDLDGGGVPKGPPVPVLAIRYDIAPAAYLLGVAAGASSASQAFVGLASSADPDGQVFLDAVFAGLKRDVNGAQLVTETVTPDADNFVAPDAFKAALLRIRQRAGAGYKANHYFVLAGRVTPSVMYALSSDPTDAYLLGGWGDFTQVRPAKIIGCAVKHPGAVLTKLLAGTPAIASLQQQFASGKVYGLADGAIDITSIEAYGRYNPDAKDIAESVDAARGEIVSGELDVRAQMDKFRAARN